MRVATTIVGRLDRWSSSSRTVWVLLPQLALVALGMHLAGNAIDDVFLSTLRILTWPANETPQQISTWSAIILELALITWAGIMLVRARLEERVPDIRTWLRRMHPTSVGGPLFWLSTSCAGGWRVGMAVEDGLVSVLPAEIATALGWIAAALVVWRFGLTATWTTLTRVPIPPYRMKGWLWTPAALTMAGLAVWHGLPIWGWLG